MTNAWDSHGSCSLFGIFVFPQFLHMSHLTRLLLLNCQFPFSGCLSQRILVWIQGNVTVLHFMCTHMNLCWIFPLCFGTDPAPPWTVLPSWSLEKGRSSQQCAGQQQLVDSTPCSPSTGMSALLGDLGEGQQAKAIQVLVHWGSVLLPSWTLCVVLLPPPENTRC